MPQGSRSRRVHSTTALGGFKLAAARLPGVELPEPEVVDDEDVGASSRRSALLVE